MGILTESVNVHIAGAYQKHLSELGYKLPMYYDKSTKQNQYKHNIDWKIIQQIGELRYLDKKGKDNQFMIDYSI